MVWNIIDTTERPIFSMSAWLSLSRAYGLTPTHIYKYCWSGMFSRCIGGGLLHTAPSGRRVSATLSLPALLLLITAAPVLPWGKLTLLYTTALLVVSLRNYLCFNSLLCNKGRKHTQIQEPTDAHRIWAFCLWCRIHQDVLFQRFNWERIQSANPQSSPFFSLALSSPGDP